MTPWRPTQTACPAARAGRSGLRHRGPAGRNLTGMTEVVIHTDGACSGNPGPGGWGVVLQCQDKEKEMYGGDPRTTHNRMGLMAALPALQARQRPAQGSLYTDSTYPLTRSTQRV